ncbi:amino acid ABC transporter substrate-binding protein [Pseudogemmobacter sp. W21_MBD1_M6]|uniref:amino acid ABC transporter substrate-binding protein n=1 Tax=Pseudogemmobacter sp. W21_MBD1_M6 TaxID=3240271 RepID=UPI003F97FE9C
MIGRCAKAFATACAAVSLTGTIAFARCEDLPTGLDAVQRPQNMDRTEVGQDYDTIQDQGFIRIGLYNDFAPYSWKDEAGVHGVDVVLGQRIADYLQVEPHFVFFDADENVGADLRNYIWKGHFLDQQVVNVMMHVPYNNDFACRNEMVVFTGQYFVENISIAYRKDVYPEDAPVPAYFRFDKVGVENDSVADFYLSGLAKGQILPNLVHFTTPAGAMAALSAGEVSAVMGARAQLEYGLTDAMAVHAPPYPGLVSDKWTLGVAIRQNFRQLAYAVDDAIAAALADGSVAAAFAAQGLSYTAPDR